jgi:hypothetical protein
VERNEYEKEKEGIIFFLASFAGERCALPFLATSTDLCATQFHLRARYEIALTRVAALLAVALLLLAWGAMAPAALFLGSNLPTSLCAPNAKLAGLGRTQQAGIHQLQLRSKGSSHGRVVAAGARAQAVSVQSPSVTFSTSEVNCPQKPLIFYIAIEEILLFCSLLCTAFEILHCVF